MSAAEDRKQALFAHLAELKCRFVYAMLAFLASTVLCYIYAPDIYQILVHPLAQTVEGEARRMIYTGLLEAFLTYLRLAVFGGVCLSFPVLAYQVYAFVRPGLHAHEKNAFVPYLIAAPAMFIMGAAFCYFYIFPTAWKFFLGFETQALAGGLPIQMEAKVSEYLSLVIHLILAFGFSFQLPIIMVLLVQTGLASVDTFRKGRRYAIVIIVTIAAFITPPDLFSQLALSVPLYALYELAIFLCRFIKTKPHEEPHAATAVD